MRPHFLVSVKGTLAIVLTAKQRGLVPSAGQIIRALIDFGFRIDDCIIKEALTQIVSEQWPS